jgi:hypothetical protein
VLFLKRYGSPSYDGIKPIRTCLESLPCQNLLLAACTGFIVTQFERKIHVTGELDVDELATHKIKDMARKLGVTYFGG